MKILLYGLNFAPEQVGIGKYSGELARFLADRGHSIRVITATPYFPQWRVDSKYRNTYTSEKVQGVRIIRCPLWVPRRPSGITRLMHLASFALSSFSPLLAQVVWRPDVVITVAPAFFCAPGALLLGRICGRRTITWLHIQDFELDAAFELGILKGRQLRLIAEFFERCTLKAFARVSSISPAMVKHLEIKGVASSRTSLLTNWVDLDAISPQQDASRLQNLYRLELGISPDQLVLMYSGSMNKKQGLEILVDAIRLLSDCQELVWLFVGDGPTKADLKRATVGFSQVIYLPLQPRERLNDLLNAADIHLLPQKGCASDLVLPSKLMGILASGRPVVATSNPGSELAQLSVQAGSCTKPGNAVTFAKALRQLIDDPQQRHLSGSRARKLAEEHFGKEAVLKSFEKQILFLQEST